MLNKNNVAPLLITAALAVIFYRVSRTDTIYIRLSETFFQTALVSLLLGFCCIVRNGGLFKGLTYISYRMYRQDIRKQKKNEIIPANEKENNFAEFINARYSKKWNSTPYFVFAGVFALLFLILLLINS